jgi:signal transduction histidine kinase
MNPVGTPAHLAPAALAGIFLAVLSVLVLVANHRRPINRVWAAGLILVALWQGSIALAYAHPVSGILRLTLFLGAASLCAAALLKETIIAPWRSLQGQLRSVRLHLGLLACYAVLVLIPRAGSAAGEPAWRRDPIVRGLDAGALVWLLLILGQCLAAYRTRRASGVARSELLALVVVIISSLASSFATIVVAGFLGVRGASWGAPGALVAGLSVFSFLLVRNEVFDARGLRRWAILLSTRGLLYSFVLLLWIAFLAQLASMAPLTRFSLGTGAVLAVVLIPSFDRRLRALIDRQTPSPDLLDAREAINALIERSSSPAELYSGFLDVLRRWSDGSAHIAFSDGAFTAAWPDEPLPESLVQLACGQKWISPEIADRRASHRRELDFMLTHRIAAVVGVQTQSGGRLVAAFENRADLRPFSTLEMREAHELLGLMSLGFSHAKLVRRLMSNERLNFYGRQAPRFAHELRNGLYLQTQILGRIASGHGAEVQPADAELCLGRIRQVDLLCSQFLNVRAIHEQPVGMLPVGELLAGLVDESLRRLMQEAGVACRIRFQAEPGLRIIASAALLRTAVSNLVKNATEALQAIPGPREVELAAFTRPSKLCLQIADNGPGMPSERLAHPFEPGASTKELGMGLGLTLARDCIEAMGGTLELVSSTPQGTRFEITLANLAD